MATAGFVFFLEFFCLYLHYNVNTKPIVYFLYRNIDMKSILGD